MIEEIKSKQKELKNFNVENEELTPEEEALLFSCKSFPLRYQNRGRKWVKPLSYLLVILLAVSGFILAFTGKPELMPVVIVVSFVLLIIIVIKERQIDMMKRLTQYFRDENGEFYRVIFTQGASIMAVHHRYRRGIRHRWITNVEQKAQKVDRNLEEAQETMPAFYYVQRYKQGIKDWDPLNGGLAKVAYLKNFRLINEGSKKSTYTCEINGKKKTLKILNAYEGLKESVRK